MDPAVHTIEVVLGLILALAIIAALARLTRVPTPLAFIAGGVVLSFLPGLENVHLDPDIFFLLFIPPLLYSDGQYAKLASLTLGEPLPEGLDYWGF